MDRTTQEQLRAIRYRMTSLTNSGETLIEYLRSVETTSGSSPLLRSAVAATSELVSLMTAGLSVLQFDMERLHWTDDFTPLENWKRHWHTAYESFVTQTNFRYMDDVDCDCSD